MPKPSLTREQALVGTIETCLRFFKDCQDEGGFEPADLEQLRLAALANLEETYDEGVFSGLSGAMTAEQWREHRRRTRQ